MRASPDGEAALGMGRKVTGIVRISTLIGKICVIEVQWCDSVMSLDNKDDVTDVGGNFKH